MSSRVMVDETGKLFDLRRVKQPFCSHEVDESVVYKSGLGCVVDLYMRCSDCGKKFPVKPNFREDPEFGEFLENEF